MPSSPEQHRTEHSPQYDLVEARENTKDMLFYGGSLTKEQLDDYIYGEPRETDDSEQSQWNLINQGMAHDKLDDEQLEVFAQAVGKYTNDAIKEIMDDRDYTSDYVFRDDLLMEKQINIESTLTAHSVNAIMARSTGEPENKSYQYYTDIVKTATSGRWEEIPAKIRAA